MAITLKQSQSTISTLLDVLDWSILYYRWKLIYFGVFISIIVVAFQVFFI
jgi:hypothetical protein